MRIRTWDAYASRTTDAVVEASILICIDLESFSLPPLHGTSLFMSSVLANVRLKHGGVTIGILETTRDKK